MIETSLSSTLAATVLHRVSGTVDEQQAEQGAAEALLFVQHIAAERRPIDLVLDMRGRQFESLRAHRAWSEGFARNPALHGYVRYVAIVGDDTPAFRAEQELIATDQVQLFVELGLAEQWLSSVATPHEH